MQAIKDQQTIREWATALGVPFTIVQPWQLRLQLDEDTAVDIYPRQRRYDYRRQLEHGSTSRSANYQDVQMLLDSLQLGPDALNHPPVTRIGPSCELPVVMELKGATEGLYLVHLRHPYTVARASFHRAGEVLTLQEGRDIVVPGYSIILQLQGRLEVSAGTCRQQEQLVAMAQYFAAHIIPAREGRYKRYRLPA